jgi:hypothetical protein
MGSLVTHRIAQRRTDAGGRRVEQRPVRHVGALEGELHVEAVPFPARDYVHVVMRLVLSSGGPAADDDVHSFALRDPLDRRGNAHRDGEQVSAQLARNVEERFVMLARHYEDVTGVDGLDVHERNRVGILVACGHFARPADEIAKGAMRGA